MLVSFNVLTTAAVIQEGGENWFVSKFSGNRLIGCGKRM